MRRVAVLLAAVLASLPPVAAAQGVVNGIGPLRQPVFESAPIPPALADTSMHIRPTHWVTGAAIGGTALGLLTGFTAMAVCGMDDSSAGLSTGLCFVSGLLGGALLGGTIGALIGGQFPKHEPWNGQGGAAAP